MSLIKRWRQLERDQKEIDYRKSVWCRDARAAHNTDLQFTRWCESDLGVTTYQADELLKRAAAVKVIPDAETWQERGGFKSIEPVLAFPRKEQIAIIQAAKVENRSIVNVIRLRHPVAPISPSNPAPTPTAAERRKMSDAAALAQYMAEHCTGLPADIVARIQMYVPSYRPSSAPVCEVLARHAVAARDHSSTARVSRIARRDRSADLE